MESSRLKRIASKLHKNPRRINKEMACKIYEQTDVIVAIGSGNKSTRDQAKLCTQGNKNEQPVKGAEIDCRVFLKALCVTSRQKGFMLSHILLGGHFAPFEVS